MAVKIRYMWCFLVLVMACGEDPKPKVNVPPPNTGALCEDNLDCSRGLECHATALGGGRCTARCADRACPTNGACVDVEAFGQWQSMCALSCDATTTCPDGLSCQQVGEQSVCAPVVPALAQDPSLDWASISEHLNITCEATKLDTPDGEGWSHYELKWTSPGDVRRMWIAAFVDRGQLENLSLQWSARSLDLTTEYNHHSIRFTELNDSPAQPTGTYGAMASEWAFLLPFASRFQDYVRPNETYTLNVRTSDASPCLHVWSEDSPRKVLHLNIYLTGVLGMTANQAPFDLSMQTVIKQVRLLLASTGEFERVEIDFFDMPEAAQSRFGIIRDINELRELTGMGKLRGKDPYWARALDVFMVQSFMIDDIPGLVGFSGALPGAPGLSGHGMQGLTFASFMLGTDNIMLGTIIAHEIGHFLGLRHTTEVLHNQDTPLAKQYQQRTGTTDPLMDTPECADLLANPYACPDASNLMFPLTPPTPAQAIKSSLTPEQNFVLTGFLIK